MQYKELLPKKPEAIALSFSGGGFRAAAYALGCLSYMETVSFGEQKLTALIRFISSASGGSFTNLAYTAGQRKGESFAAFYKRFYGETLEGTRLVTRVFEILRDKQCWKQRPDKARNLINAFSMAYDELIFGGETFELYYKQPQQGVPEVCVNSTEFDNGMLFRFQVGGIFGNKFLHSKTLTTPTKALQQIKLGDILAASSCFPVGFEPIMFPKDFTHEHLPAKELEQSLSEDTRFSPEKNEGDTKKAICFGLMDGGIDDNQGIDSFINAEDRLQRANHFGYDLYISCDVSSNYTSGYNFPVENKKNVFQKLSVLFYVLIVLVLFGVSLAGVLNNVLRGWSDALLGISSVLVLLVAGLFMKGWKARRSSIKGKNTYGIVIFKHIGTFLNMRLSGLLQLLSSRGSSAGYLAAVVFLKKIRRISYDRLFEKITERKLKADGKPLGKGEPESLLVTTELKHWRSFALQNAIYLLSDKNNAQRQDDLAKEPWFGANPMVNTEGQSIALIELMQPSPALQAVASLATGMDTTLWFDDNHIQENRPAALVATGQFTTCYNLLRYAYRFDGKDAYWKEVQEQLVKDWARFNSEPYWLEKANSF